MDGVVNALVIRARPVEGSAAALGDPAAQIAAASSPTLIPSIRFRGVVEAALPNGYRVSGQTVVVTATTRVEGPIAVGTQVDVMGAPLADGSILALRIRVEAPQAEVEFRGVVEAIQPDGYRIAGRTVIVTATTPIEGPITVGSMVEVRGLLQPDGTILALRIHREEEERPEIEFAGIVEAALPNGYRISGQTVVVTATTRVEGPIAVGSLVEVRGIPQPDGTIQAVRIRLKGEIRFEGVVEAIRPDGYQIAGVHVVVTSTTRIDGPIAVGAFVEVEGILQPDGSVLAHRIHVEEEEEQEIEFQGRVEEILPNGYRIGGRTVVVTSTTRIDGPITVGAFVEVKGILQPDGFIRAVQIHLEDQSEDGSGSIQKGKDGQREEDRKGDEDRHEEEAHEDEHEDED